MTETLNILAAIAVFPLAAVAAFAILSVSLIAALVIVEGLNRARGYLARHALKLTRHLH